jgi:hypothetical protein
MKVKAAYTSEWGWPWICCIVYSGVNSITPSSMVQLPELIVAQLVRAKKLNTNNNIFVFIVYFCLVIKGAKLELYSSLPHLPPKHL